MSIASCPVTGPYREESGSIFSPPCLVLRHVDKIPLSLLTSRLNYPSYLIFCLSEICSRSFMALLWTYSSKSLPFLYWGVEPGLSLRIFHFPIFNFMWFLSGHFSSLLRSLLMVAQLSDVPASPPSKFLTEGETNSFKTSPIQFCPVQNLILET